MRTKRVALRPENEAPRRSGQTTRGTTNHISSNVTHDTLSARRVQLLIARFGLTAGCARVIADLAWEGGSAIHPLRLCACWTSQAPNGSADPFSGSASTNATARLGRADRCPAGAMLSSI